MLNAALADLASLLIYIVGTIVCSQAKTGAVFVGMRVLQSLGSSAVLALGAGTLADMYDVRDAFATPASSLEADESRISQTHERGEKLGIYYAAPLLGPSLGVVLRKFVEGDSGGPLGQGCALSAGGRLRTRCRSRRQAGRVRRRERFNGDLSEPVCAYLPRHVRTEHRCNEPCSCRTTLAKLLRRTDSGE